MVLQFVLLFLLIQAGNAIGITTSDSLFLLSVGSEHLPKVYVLVPVVMLLYISFSSALITRLGLGRFFWIVLSCLVAGGVILFFLLGLSEPEEPEPVVLYAAKIYAAVVYISLYSLSWNFTYQYFTILEGKRLFAFFTGGSAVGAIMGGITINVLSDQIPFTAFYLIWSGLALLALPVLSWIISTGKVIETDTLEEEDVGERKAKFFDQIAGLSRIIRKSRYVLIFLAVLFCAQILTTLNEYQYLDIFSTKYKDEASLAALFGKLYIGVNLFNLFVSTFVFNRMVLRFGVRNVALILPVVYVAVFGWMFLEYGMMAGFFGFFAYQGLMISVDYDNTNLLLNALPSEAKTQVRIFIEGLAEPLATATAGLFLLSIGTTIERDVISLIGIGGSVCLLLLVFTLRHQYVGAMISNLKKSWLDFTRDATDLVTGLGERDVAILRRKAHSRDPELTPSAVRILRLNDEPAAAAALLEFMSHTPVEDRREAELLFSELVRRDDNELFRIILDWLDRDQTLIDNELIQEISVAGLPQVQNLARLVKSPGPGEKATRAIQLLKSWKIDERAEGLEMFEELFGQDDASLMAAVQAIGRSEEERYAHFIAPFLEHPNSRVSNEALRAVNRLVNRRSGRLLPALLDVVRSGEIEQRRQALDALIRIGDADSVYPLLRLSDSLTAAERRRAEQVVESVGLQGVPIAVSVCRDGEMPYRGRATAARALARLAFPQFEDIFPGLIEPELELAYESLHRYTVLSTLEGDLPGVRVLSRLYLDARVKIIDFILELFSIGGRLPDFELISASLRSVNPKERGNAIETIEQGISQSLFRVLQPLIDSRSLENRVRFYRGYFNPPELTPLEIVKDALTGNFPPGRMAAAKALQELAPDDFAATLRRRLTEDDSPGFRSVALSLLDGEGKGLNLVERIHYLMESSLFGSFGVVPLQYIAGKAAEETIPAGEVMFRAGDVAEDLFCLTGGTVRIEGAWSQLGDLKKGEVFGEGCLFGSHRLGTAVTAEGCVLLRIPKNAVWKTVDVFPEIALRLLESSTRKP